MIPLFRAFFLTMVLTLSSGLASFDAIDLSLYTGDYEIYTGDRYVRITIYVEEGGLVSREENKDSVIRLSPIAGEVHAFSGTGETDKKVHYYRFQPDETGEFQICQIRCEERNLEAIRIDPGAASACDPGHHFPVDQLRDDLRQLWQFIETEHPAPYVFTNEKEYAQILAELEAALVSPLQMSEFFEIGARLLSHLGCGHTRLITPRCVWSTQPDRLFPLELRLLADGIFVAADHDSAGLIPLGSEIIAINGEDAQDLMASLENLVTTDGFNLSARRARLGIQFPFCYALTRGFPQTYEVTYRPPGETKSASARVAAVTMQCILDGLSRRLAVDPLDIDILAGGGVARMTIRSFSFYDQLDYFKAFVDSSMALVRESGIDQLILDLRGNTGGDPWCTSHLLSYLIREPVPYFAEEYGPYAPLASPVARAEQPYTGDLYVLTDGQCFSSTGHFCSLLKYHGIGTFVGEETGGTYTCNDGTKLVELCHTRLLMSLPRETFTAAVEGFERGRGLQPDHAVAPTGADLAAGHDVVLDSALKLATEAGRK